MTLAEIYSAIVANIFLESDVLPANINTLLLGATAMIGRAYKWVQTDFNYWFMEDTIEEVFPGEITKTGTGSIGGYTLTLSDEILLEVGMRVIGTGISKWAEIVSLAPCTLNIANEDDVSGDVVFLKYKYDLPLDFKKDRFIRVLNPNGSAILLDRISNMEYEKARISSSNRSGYPLSYCIQGDKVVLLEDCTDDFIISMRYYKYHTYPATDDVVTQNSGEVIVNLVSTQLAKMLGSPRIQVYAEEFKVSREALIRQHNSRYDAFEKMRYSDI